MTVVSSYSEIGSFNNDPANYDELMTRYAPLVKRIAYHMMGRLPSNVQLDDMVQAGMIGLFEALKGYDMSRGASFETYARIRIRGAMIDEVRRGDWTPTICIPQVTAAIRGYQEGRRKGRQRCER